MATRNIDYTSPESIRLRTVSDRLNEHAQFCDEVYNTSYRADARPDRGPNGAIYIGSVKRYGVGVYTGQPLAGCEPLAQQTKGMGRMALAEMCELADAYGVPLFLWCEHPKPRAIYESLGFVITKEEPRGEGRVYWHMWREPRTKGE